MDVGCSLRNGWNESSVFIRYRSVRVDFEAGGSLRSPPHFDGTRELVYVDRGRVIVESGDESSRLGPGDSYQYTSGCPLSTPSGFMVGSYTMRGEDGELFDIAIPAFSLDLPGRQRVMN